MKLVEVHARRTWSSRAPGVRERIDLERARAPRPAPATATRPRTRGFKINVASAGTNSYTLSRKELDDALRDPNQLSYLGASAPAPQAAACAWKPHRPAASRRSSACSPAT